MRLLYIDADIQAARQLHGELLEYRATNWNLVHCSDASTAADALATDAYQAILYRSDETLVGIESALEKLLADQTCPPVIGLTQSLQVEQQLKLVERGFEDCLDQSNTDGMSVMRSLRIAEMRRSRTRASVEALVECKLDFVSERIESILSDESSTRSPSSEGTLLNVAVLACGESITVKSCVQTQTLAITQFSSVQAFIDSLNHEAAPEHKPWDALIVETSIFEVATDRERIKLESQLLWLPCMVVTLEKSDFAALTYIQRGYLDCLIADQCDHESILMSIKKAILRSQRTIKTAFKGLALGSKVQDRRAKIRSGADRRRHSRYYFESSVIAIPVLPNGAPDVAGRSQATSVDLSISGMAVRMPNREQIPQRNWILGVDQGHNRIGYIHAFLRRAQYVNNELHAGLVFQSDAEDFLSSKSLTPNLDPQTMRFDTKISNESLEKWVELGVLRKQLSRKTSVCPDCKGTCTIASGCKECGSFDVKHRDLIHHFACAHVTFEHEFKQKDKLACPKCHCENLVAGADFETIRSQYECKTCTYVGDTMADVGCCLNCDLRFPIALAPEVEVYGYDVERLDVLALIDSTR